MIRTLQPAKLLGKEDVNKLYFLKKDTDADN